MKVASVAIMVSFAAMFPVGTDGLNAQGIDELPKIVQGEIRKADAACRKGGGRPTYEPLELVRAEDISADGVEDFFVDYSKYTCLGTGRAFCGSGGCNLQIFVSAERNRWIKAFDELVLTFSLEQEKGRTVAIIETTGIHCGRARSETCKRRLVAERTAIRYLD